MTLTSTHWGAYRIHTNDGKITKITPFEGDSDPSPIGLSMGPLLDDKSRITAPMVRRSWLENGPGAAPEKRGSDAFVAIGWDEAEKLVADELTRVIGQKGNEAIYAGSYGWASAGRFHHAQSQIHRFLNAIGGYTKSVNTYSFAAAEVVMPHILGNYMEMMPQQTSWQSICDNAELFVAFGGLAVKNSQISNGGTGDHIQDRFIKRAAARGVEFVNVSPRRSDISDDIKAHWVPIRPNSDVALMLAIAHELIINQHVDMPFISRYTIGFERFSDYVMGTSDGVAKDVEWAADLCGIAADDIRDLADKMGRKRVMISLGWSLSRQHHGEQPFFAGVTLAAMLGQMGNAGTGVGFGYAAANSVGNNINLLPHMALPQGGNPVESFIPVARVSDMLLNPGAEFDYDGGRYTYPDIDIVYWAGGNPFHHHQDLNRMRRAWQKPATVIVHDWCWNAAAKHADIVLPVTTMLERDDIGLMPRDPYIFAMDRAVEPNALARNDYDILAGIAAHMGAAEDFTQGRDSEGWIQWIWDHSSTRAKALGVDLPRLDALRQMGWYKIPDRPDQQILQHAFFTDPDANPLSTPSGKIELYSETMAGFGYDDCPGHAAWREPQEWLGNKDISYPLHLLSNQPKTKLHSQLDHSEHSRAARINGREPVEMHPIDAAARGLADGDIVRVFNDRGACLAGVTITDAIAAGVVMISTGAWYDPADPAKIGSLCKHGNPNVLAPDLPTSKLAQGPGAHSCLVEIERYADAPPVTAHEPPIIIQRGGAELRARDK